MLKDDLYVPLNQIMHNLTLLVLLFIVYKDLNAG